MNFKRLIQTQKLTPEFCAQVVLNDFVPKSEEDQQIGEKYILKYQPHISEQELETALQLFHNSNTPVVSMYIAISLTRDEKIALLEKKYGRELQKMGFEKRNTTMRRMIRKMTSNDWFMILQEKAISSSHIPYSRSSSVISSSSFVTSSSSSTTLSST